MCAVMTASTPTSSTEGERGQGYGRGACVRVCCGPNAGMSLIYYHLRGWWCSGSVMWCCCCRSAAGSNRLRCASLFWNSCRLKEVAARGGGPLRLRGTWHGLGRYSLVPRTTGCLARPGAMPGHQRSWLRGAARWLAGCRLHASMHARTGAARCPYAEIDLDSLSVQSYSAGEAWSQSCMYRYMLGKDRQSPAAWVERRSRMVSRSTAAPQARVLLWSCSRPCA